MAVDTAAKRQSALTFGLSFIRGLIPDGSLDQSDRQTISFSYGGILAAIPVPDVIIDTIRLTAEINRSMSLVSEINRSISLKVEA